jgi:cellulose synthase/poly-beta-1,6-N-acetylglucosamine synthase-like glycosyltransferase
LTPASLIYTATALLLAVYALNSLILVILFLRHRSAPTSPASLTRFPRVTVQLPVYNEALVIDRLIQAAARLDWPRDRLQIQVLDDSTDETTGIAQACTERCRAEGIRVELVRRVDRSGFKAGALRAGLKRANGELIAIFDADFVPEPDWLHKTVPYFLDRPRLGMVQTRWTHLNRDYSLLTRAQAIAIDGHFVVEQTARSRSGLLFGFNGTAGIWRRSCIVAAGGWQADTICEDLDLSFRAQLDGWECLYLPHVTAPAEVPPQLAALKRQQFRWAKGSIQCLSKLAGPVATSRLPLLVRGLALAHLSTYLIHPLLLVSLLVTLPLMLASNATVVSLSFVGLLSLAPPLMYALSEMTLYRDRWLRHYIYLPVLMLLGTGIALNNTRGVVEALLRVNNVFQRTPKFRIEGHGGRWLGSRYTLPFNGIVAGELALSLYALVAVVAAWQHGYAHVIPFLMLYVAGFGYVGSLGLWESRADLARRLRGWLAHGAPARARNAELTARVAHCRRQPSSSLGYQPPVSHVPHH